MAVDGKKPMPVQDADLDGIAAGGEDSIMVLGLSHEIVSPRDAASGLPTGKRQHKPFTAVIDGQGETPPLDVSFTLTRE